MSRQLRRAFVAVWIALGVAGALDHTIAERWLGGQIDLGLPHLQYGYVMFNANPRRVPVFTYARADGERHDLADLEPRPAPGYARARVALDAMFTPVYLRDLCNRALRTRDDEITIYAEGYQVDIDREHPAITSTVTCNARPSR
ncbi:MAG TPA: hypothetical protein VGF94_02065 [Kofleriaceae bacterium]|jgi:hypothetical protein